MESKRPLQRVDVVYAIGTGSRWDNNELRFSIRSVYKNLKGFGRIIIVGEKPPFIDGVTHIQYPDRYPKTNADGNIIEKVLQACRDPGVSEKFLFMNDDHIILKPVKISEIPSYHKGCLSSYDPTYFDVNPWRQRLLQTKLALEKLSTPTLHFDCHTPILLEKKKFIATLAKFDYKTGIGLTMKSLYGNLNCKNAPLLAEEKKVVFTPHTLAQLAQKFTVPYLMAFNDEGLNNSLRVFLYTRFPHPSPLETIPFSDPIIDIYRAAHESPSYQFAVDVFLRHFKNENIKSMILADRSQRFLHKMNYLFNQKLQNL